MTQHMMQEGLARCRLASSVMIIRTAADCCGVPYGAEERFVRALFPTYIERVSSFAHAGGQSEARPEAAVP